MRIKKILSVVSIALMLLAAFALVAYAECTSIIVGKGAAVDGSVMTSHTCDSWYDASLKIIPAADHKPGEMAPVYFDKLHADYKEVKKISEIPEVPHTYKYFWIGYPFANEHQLIIGEDTLGGHPDTRPGPDAIMWIEQLQIFALQRAKTAREAIKVMGELAEKYGYGDGAESLTVTDPNEAWVFEIFGVGPLWTPKSGKPGAAWCAQRVPDDHFSAAPNMSRIDEIDPNDTENFLVCDNYLSTAIELGLYDPASGKPFSWRNTYGWVWYRGRSKETRWPRLWWIYSQWAPSAGDWTLETAPDYPFSVKPDKLLSVQDVYTMFSENYVGSAIDNTEDPNYYAKTKDGWVKSPLATPQVYRELRDLLDIQWYRPIPVWRNSYHFISQARDWLPNEIGGVLWFGLDNPENSVVLPVWVGITEVPPSWALQDRTKVNRDSAFWAFGLVDDCVNQYYGVLKPILDEMRDPLQEELFAEQDSIEQEALKLYKNSPEEAQKFLTEYTVSTMKRVEKAYWEILDVLLYEGHNNWRPYPGARR